MFCIVSSSELDRVQVCEELSKLVKQTLIGEILTKFNTQTEMLFGKYLSDFVRIVQTTSLEGTNKEKFYEVSEKV